MITPNQACYSGNWNSKTHAGRGDAPVVKWHIAFLGVTALLAAYTSFAENDIGHLDFSKGRSGASESKHEDGS